MIPVQGLVAGTLDYDLSSFCYSFAVVSLVHYRICVFGIQ